MVVDIDRGEVMKTTGRSTAVGLSLMCALAFCAIVAANAAAKGTTAVECTSGAVTKDFADAHCDKAQSGGSFGHIGFVNNTITSVSAVNDLTGTASSFILEGKIAAVSVAITCESVSATSSVTNSESSGAMTISFGTAQVTFNFCKMLAPASGAGKCSIFVSTASAVPTDPMNLGVSVSSKTGPTGEQIEHPINEAIFFGTEMGLKFSSTGGGVITKITISGLECPAALKSTFNVEGFAFATGGRGGAEATTSSGATLVFTKASTIEGLKFAGNPATLEGTLTTRKFTGNPLSITTTTK